MMPHICLIIAIIPSRDKMVMQVLLGINYRIIRNTFQKMTCAGQYKLYLLWAVVGLRYKCLVYIGSGEKFHSTCNGRCTEFYLVVERYSGIWNLYVVKDNSIGVYLDMWYPRNDCVCMSGYVVQRLCALPTGLISILMDYGVPVFT